MFREVKKKKSIKKFKFFFKKRLKVKINKEKSSEKNKEIVFDYLEIVLKRLENKNAAETIAKITGIQKNGEKYKFEVNLEDSALPNFSIDSSIIENLDKGRENSLFSIYTIAQKTPFSLISQNV